MIFENVFIIWATEALMLLYVLSVCRDIKLDKKDNLFAKLNRKYGSYSSVNFEDIPNEPEGYFSKIFTNAFSNIFKKTPDVNTDPLNKAKLVRDDFTNFVGEVVLFLQASIFLLAILLTLYIFFKLLNRSFKRFFSSTSHIIPPQNYTPYNGITIDKWLEDMESFFEATFVTNDKEKCSIILSKCNEATKRAAIAYDPRSSYSFDSLKRSLRRMYKTKTTEHDYVTEFTNLSEKSAGSIVNFYIAVDVISKLAFPFITEPQRVVLVEKKFLEGLTNDNLRAAIVLQRKQLNWLTDLFKRKKSILETTLELSELYGYHSADRHQSNTNPTKNDHNQENVTINYTKRTDSTAWQSKASASTLCYKCYGYGHYKRDSPNDLHPMNPTNKSPNTSKNQTKESSNTQTNSNTTHNLSLRAIAIDNCIRGYCNIDNINTSFIADTGANKTVVDSKLLSQTQLSKLKPSIYNVNLADGSKATVKGLLDCVLTLNSQPINLEVLVIENLPEKCLLGFDFLSIHPCTKDTLKQLEHKLNSSNDVNLSNSPVQSNAAPSSNA